MLIQHTWIYQSWRKSHANVKNEHGKFMTVQCTRTTSPKDSIDKSTLMWKMNAKCSQSSIAQELSIAPWLWRKKQEMKKNQMKKWCTHSVLTIPHPRSTPGCQRTKEKWRRTEIESQFAIKCPPVKIGTQCWHYDLFHPSPLFLVSKFCLPAPPLGHIPVKSSLLSGLKNLIWSSLCHLNPHPMIHSFLSHAKSTSSHHSSFFPCCIICSTQCLHHIFLMPFWNNTMHLTLPWNTHREHMPHPNIHRDWHFKGNPSSPCLWPIAATLHLWHKVYWNPTITPGTPGHLFLIHTHFYHASSPWWSHPDSSWLTSSHMIHWVISESLLWLNPLTHTKSYQVTQLI